jgi:hypothetical protein
MGDVPLELVIARLVDLPHAARADWREDLVGIELRSLWESHVDLQIFADSTVP